MHYLKVLVGEATYHGREALTYTAAQPLPTGSVVVVPLKNQRVLGIVEGAAQKPSFAVKEIFEVPALPPLPRALLRLHSWLQNYYPAPLGIITQLLLPRKLPKVLTLPPQAHHDSSIEMPPLTKDQSNALSQIKSHGLHVLHGATGTGKTRVYIELAKSQLQHKRSSIILTPEISLTSQLANDFRATFGDETVKVIHSQLTDTTRQRLWAEILQTKHPLIIIGPRSALFCPLSTVGLVVVDECHEPAYKQDQAPYYHANVVGAKLAALHQATFILGSATPPITDYYIAKAKGRPIIFMNQLASGSTQQEHRVTIVDHRDRQAFSKSPHLSNALIKAIGASLSRKEQSLLFLNRRGTARVIFCEQCGWQALCPHCDLPLIYHGDSHAIRCHSCGFRTATTASCPDCGNPSIIFKSIGTKAIIDELTRLFPSAITKRYDTDNKKSERIEQHYNEIHAGQVDIIVGTQTIAKGLDLPKLGLVGVINAETGLSFPDFSATERTFQLLIQVLGRVGRGHRATHAIVQTYAPEGKLIQAAIQKNWDVFYNSELAERRQFSFPPFCYLLKLTCRRASSNAAERTAKILHDALLKQHPSIIVEGPAAAFHEKQNNKYQWQLVVKARNRGLLLSIIANLPNGWSYDIDPLNLL